MGLGKFLFGTAITAAVATGVYRYLDQTAKQAAAEADDPEEAPGVFDSENIKNAANRAYTTIQHGTEETWTTIKKNVGPEGEEVIHKVAGAAGVVKDTVASSAKKVGEVVADENATGSEKFANVVDTVKGAAVELGKGVKDEFTAKESPIDVTAEDVTEAAENVADDAAEAFEGVKEETAEAAEEVSEKVEDAAEEAAETVSETVSDAAEDFAAKADKVEEFFDDEK